VKAEDEVGAEAEDDGEEEEEQEEEYLQSFPPETLQPADHDPACLLQNTPLDLVKPSSRGLLLIIIYAKH
jgi:hypothetical protein